MTCDQCKLHVEKYWGLDVLIICNFHGLGYFTFEKISIMAKNYPHLRRLIEKSYVVAWFLTGDMQRFPACSESLLGIWCFLQIRMGLSAIFSSAQCDPGSRRWFAEIPMLMRSVMAYELVDRFWKANPIWKCVICNFYILLEFGKILKKSFTIEV